ncbi:MAG: PKD domain-containing protein [Bacteroidota bacterium]
MAKKMMLSSRIDEQVLFTFLGVGLLSLIIFGFRYISHPNCLPITIQVGDNIVEGKVTTFKAETNIGTSFHWNFGDNEVSDEETPSTRHVYKHPGNYIVSVLVNGSCDESIPIFVQAGSADSVTALKAIIEFSKNTDTVGLNEEFMLSDVSPNSTNRIWNLGEPGVSEQHTQNVKFAYSTPGPKKVILTVNEKAVAYKNLYVRERELPKLPEIKMPKAVAKKTDLGLKDDPDIKPLQVPTNDKPKPEPEPVPVEKIKDPPVGYLESVFKGVMAGGEWKESFSKYMCSGDLNLPVVYNGNNTTLSQVCIGLSAINKKEVKKISNVKVIPIFNKQTNCITFLNITIDKTTGVWPIKKTSHVDINQ